MTRQELQTVLLQWANSAGVPVIWANQNAPQPGGSYVTLQLLAFRDSGSSLRSGPDENGIATVRLDRTFTLSIMTIGEDALDILTHLRLSLEKETVLDVLRSEGLAFIQVLSAPQDLSETFGSRIIERYGMDIEFRYAHTVTDDVGIIETVVLEGEYPPSLTETFTVTSQPGA